MERCSAYGELLPLYAEGELGDPGLDERVRLHVLCCPLCQDWLEEYDAFTARLVECGAAAGGAGRPPRLEARVLETLRRRRPRGWSRPAMKAAAALVLLASLGLAWLAGAAWRSSPEASRTLAGGRRGAPPAVSPPALGSEAPVALGLRWVIDADDAPDDGALRRARSHREGREVRLLGVDDRWTAASRDPEIQEVRWVVHGHIGERFRHPASGGVAYLVPEPPAVRHLASDPTAGAPIPLRKLHVERAAAARRWRSAPGGTLPDGGAVWFRLVVVPDTTGSPAAVSIGEEIEALLDGSSAGRLDDLTPRLVPEELRPFDRPLDRPFEDALPVRGASSRPSFDARPGGRAGPTF